MHISTTSTNYSNFTLLLIDLNLLAVKCCVTPLCTCDNSRKTFLLKYEATVEVVPTAPSQTQ